MGTKNNPGAFDCHAAAEPDEPMFVLLGRDPMAGLLVRLWAKMREKREEESREGRERAADRRRARRVGKEARQDASHG